MCIEAPFFPSYLRHAREAGFSMTVSGVSLHVVSFLLRHASTADTIKDATNGV